MRCCKATPCGFRNSKTLKHIGMQHEAMFATRPLAGMNAEGNHLNIIHGNALSRELCTTLTIFTRKMETTPNL